MEVQRVKMYENGTSSLFSLFSTEFDRYEKSNWMEKNWTMSLYSVGAYVAFIYFGQDYMKNRKPLNLKNIMIVWNFALAIFSILGTATVLPEFISVLRGHNGFHKSDSAPCTEVSDASVFWGWMFCMSKMAELVDTVFIVLRKRQLIFLHWYHHITVLLYCWYSYSDHISPARWFVVINFFIHSLMYTYYGLRAVGISVPRPIAMTITILQLSQMIVGVVVNGYAFAAKSKGLDCDVSHHHLNLGLAMYASYFVLFAHFFYRAYFSRTGKHKSD